MLLLLSVISILYTPVVLPVRPPSCGEVCYYDGQFQIADCSGIGLQAVPTKDGCESARLLDLSYNDITSLHENEKIGNRGAQHLDFSYNSISIVEPRSFSGSNSAFYLNLFLSSNDIAVLRNETFSECEESLQQLHLDRNNIEVIESGTFKNLTKLAHLFLGHNNLQRLEATIFQDLRSLQSLYLNSNILTSLAENLFATLTRLKHLDLSSNKLFLLGDEVFNQPCQLMTVVLADNRLRNIPNPSRNRCLNRLQALDIRNNNITDASNITHYIEGTDKLFIDGNPFHCDCNLENLRKWAQQEVTFSELKCIMPSSGESKEIRTLPALCPTRVLPLQLHGPTTPPDTTVVLMQITSREEEQGDVIPQAARLEDTNIPTLPTSSRTVFQSNESPDKNKNSWVKPAILVCIIIFMFVIILPLLAKCRNKRKRTVHKETTALGPSQVKGNDIPSTLPTYINPNQDMQEPPKLINDETSCKPPNGSDESSLEECKIDVIPSSGPSIIANTENDEFNKTIGDDYKTSSHDNDIAEGEPLICKVDDEYEETASGDITKDSEESDGLGMGGTFPSYSDESTPKQCKIDRTGLRRRTPQSTDKMIPNNSPYKMSKIKDDQNASKTVSDYVGSSDKTAVDRKNKSKRRLDNQYAASKPDDIREGRTESDDLVIVGELSSNLEGENLVEVKVAKNHDYDKENRLHKSFYLKDSNHTPQNQEEGMKVRQRITPQKSGERKFGVLRESSIDNFV